MHIRKVVEADADFLWHLANDSVVREASFSIDAIPWEDHLKWLKARLDDPSCVFFVATTDDNVPIGQVRFDTKNKEAVISVSIKKDYRGKGYGTKLIQESGKLLFCKTDILKIHAYVKSSNQSSISAFLKANFKLIGQVNIENQKAMHLVKERNKCLT
jgi:RimJ/RimL family protein N-acetyltransferase